MKDLSFPSIRIFRNNHSNKHSDLGGSKPKKTTRTRRKIRNLFASSSSGQSNPKWFQVPDSPAATRATVDTDADRASSEHWKILEQWSIRGTPSITERSTPKMVRKRTRHSVIGKRTRQGVIDETPSSSLDFINNELSDWMELDADGATSPRRGNKTGRNRRKIYYYDPNDEDEDSDMESDNSVISTLTLDHPEPKDTIDDDAFAEIHEGIARRDTTYKPIDLRSINSVGDSSIDCDDDSRTFLVEKIFAAAGAETAYRCSSGRSGNTFLPISTTSTKPSRSTTTTKRDIVVRAVQTVPKRSDIAGRIIVVNSSNSNRNNRRKQLSSEMSARRRTCCDP